MRSNKIELSTDMRYDLQDAEESQREDRRGRNETLMHKCVFVCVQRDVREFSEKIG